MQADGAHAEHIIPITEARGRVSRAVRLVNSKGEHWHRPERTKVCIRCDATKPVSEFYAYSYVTRQGKRSTRYDSRCRPCARARRIAEEKAERARASSQLWRAANLDYVKGRAAACRATPEGRRNKARLQRLRKARQRAGMGGPEDRAAVRAIYAQALALESVIARCPVFDLPELGKRLHVDHIIALSKGGPHVASNLQILPAGLNIRKAAR